VHYFEFMNHPICFLQPLPFDMYEKYELTPMIYLTHKISMSSQFVLSIRSIIKPKKKIKTDQRKNFGNGVQTFE
jgi:hypothetical protein